jgi:hypothetical protein
MGFIEQGLELITNKQFAIIVGPMNDINILQKFKDHPKGTLFVFDNVFSIDNIKCFLVLFVNRVNNSILMCTT